MQCEYLETIAEVALQNQMSVEELQEKEVMRQKLESIMHDVIREYGQQKPVMDPLKVKLKCYGSLASGFAVAGSDMDLLVTFPRNGEPTGDIEEDIKRPLEKALLDVGYGARLLTQTRVPIIRVCETPTPDILDGLRRYRAKWEQDVQDTADISNGDFDSDRLPIVTREYIEAMAVDFAKLGGEPGETPLPPSPGRELPHLEYTKDCGAQCDINFSNYVALHNTSLLRTYCMHDERVRRMGLIVKAWAKARKINTPYHGTLSSYGYVLMLLHYLMNVASPPVIPNVQLMAKDRDAWANRTDFETVDGFDVRFVRDPEDITAALEGRPRNQETLGALLRGFFWYYSDHQGFHWTNHIISIRTAGGVLTKSSKGWTEAKWTDTKKTVRNRYLLCIEDPFETEHNVARTVCHSGIVAIRDEFRRARKIIERVENVRGVGWQWFEDNNEPGQDFMEVAEDRGDLLRKDFDFHKLKRLRTEVEATEKALKEANALVEVQHKGNDESKEEDGTSSHNDPEYTGGPRLSEAEQRSRKLTSVGHQQDNHLSRRGRIRRLRCDSDDDGDDTDAKDDEIVGAVNMKKDRSEDRRVSTRDRTSSSTSEKQDDSEPFYFYGTDFVPRTVDSFGKLLAWDLNTQEGRWLHWRDGKVRDGTFTGILSPGLRRLNESCPFDSLRPVSKSRDYKGKPDLIRPPFPMCKPVEKDLESTEDLVINDEASVPVTELHDGAVGWDTSISDGRWLSKRDDWIRAGTFIPPSDPGLRELHHSFPFVPKPSGDEQLRRNKNLRHRHEQWLGGGIPRLEKDNLHQPATYAPGLVASEKSEGSGWDISTADGRWLQNRDELVREGLFKRTQFQQKALRLHDQFYYMADTSPAQQIVRNLELKLWGVENSISEIPDDIREEYERQLLAESKIAQASDDVPTQDDKLDSPVAQPSAADHESTSTCSDTRGPNAEPLEWAVFNRCGKWLNERDAAMRAGTWKRRNLSGWQTSIDRAFPYQAESSGEEQAIRNEALSHWNSQGAPTRPLSNKAQLARKPHEGTTEGITLLKDGRYKTARSNIRVSWDESLLLGTWFSWRDRKIRHRNWRDMASKPFVQWLDELFPYIKKPSEREQSERNAMLKVITERHPRLKDYHGLDGDKRPSVDDMAKILSLTWDDELPSDRISVEGQSDLVDFAPAEEKVKSHNEDADYADFIRSQRLNYFTSQHQSATATDDRPENQKPQSKNVHGLLSNSDLSQVPSSSQDALASTNTMSENPTIVTPSISDKKAALVPQTLHTGPSDTRPRDEDPDIMPIPSTLSFAFDARQLRDLRIIQQGGNGCARFGGEWDVELEGEWGGGGWMGEGDGVSGEMKSGEDGSGKEGVKGEAWEGRGDEEGLLGELPGL